MVKFPCSPGVMILEYTHTGQVEFASSYIEPSNCKATSDIVGSPNSPRSVISVPTHLPILLMIHLLHNLKDPKLWELCYIPY